MKGLISKVLLLTLFCLSLAGFAAAQSFGTVKGACKDSAGQPIAGAQVVWKNMNNGRAYNLKTDKKGNYFSLGIEPGDYSVTLSRDGQVLSQSDHVHVGLEELVHDFDMKQMQQQHVATTAKQQGKSTAEVQQQIQQQQADAAKNQKFNENVKVVNEKLLAADDLLKAKSYPQAIAAYQEAATILPDNDVVLYRLGRGYIESAKAQTDAAERTKQNTEAYNNLQKAIDIKKAQPPSADPARAQKDKESLAGYYDTLGSVAARLGKGEEATKDFDQAAQIDPANASHYMFNEGITLYNNSGDEASRKKAVEALNKVIAADPNKADAYFLKGASLFAMSTQKSDGTLAPPDGTTESLQKYLELQPTGGYAEQAKGMLGMLNQKIESSYGTQKKKK